MAFVTNSTQTPSLQTTTSSSLISDEDVTTGELVFIAVAMTTLSALTVIGNIFVLIIYSKNIQLQSAKNLFIISLAIADIIIGTIPVNFYTVYLMYAQWPLGVIICNAWLIIDYWACTVSTLTLLAIAFDRFYFTWFPISHRLHSSRKYVKRVVYTIWAAAFLVWAPAILIYPYAHGEHTVPSNQCYIQFLFENGHVTLATAFCSYYGPVLLTTVLYVAVSSKLVNIKRQKVVPMNQVKSTDATGGRMMSIISDVGPNFDIRRTSQRNRQLSSSRKSLRLLFLIIIAFSVSWLPYYLSTVVVAYSKVVLPERLWRFCYIVGWGNSFLNPLCYAFGSKLFRKGFVALITCDKKKWLENKQAEISKWHVSKPVGMFSYQLIV